MMIYGFLNLIPFLSQKQTLIIIETVFTKRVLCFAPGFHHTRVACVLLGKINVSSLMMSDFAPCETLGNVRCIKIVSQQKQTDTLISSVC